MHAIARALCGASLLGIAAPAPAQQSPRTPDEREIIVSAEQITQAAIQQVQETPGGADVVPATDYADQAAVSLREALAFSPGVYAQPRFGQEVRLSIRGSGISRGYHMRGLTLLQDGVPINLADDNGDFQELDPTILQRIEVFRGANALRYGASTLGGAINGVTPTGRSANGWRVRIDGGSFETLRGLVSVGFADARGDAYLSLAADTSNGDRVHADRRGLRFNGNVGIRLTDDVETRFYASAQSLDQDLPGALTYTAVRNTPRAGNSVGDQGRNIDSIRLQNRTRFEIGEGHLDAGMFLNAKQLDHPIFQVLDYKSTDWGLYARLDQRFGALGLTAGVSARFGTVDSKRFVNNAGRRGAPTYDADLAARTIDAYAEARLEAMSGLTLVAGAVFTSGMREQELVFPAAAFDEVSYDELSPKLGLLFEPAQDVQFYANYSRSHELPGYSELAQSGPTIPTGSFVALDPQRGWTAEIGGRGRIGPVTFDVSVYRADLNGELLQFNVNPPAVPAATFNAGDTRHQGIEAGLDIVFARWATLRQVYQYNDFRFRDDPQFGDNRLPVVPEHLYRGELVLGSEALHVAPRVEWLPRGAFADYANSFRPDGYVLLGFTAEARLREGLTLFLDARNLTDRDEVGDIGAVIAYSPANAIFYPVERRAVFGGVRAAF
ncbi:TonB-dependent receptor family protein [Sphingosinithalassobacter sp. CS137]|uniref:TonB-dependent receptor family protein n=1 Tax=Sphingosinithalassobacter sp. CS137 TaxID=2762748 RepID=UPI00165D5642|nr:TonB-dependent receptor [Sphingosinithalassobacter sp. CS137]